jgi:hypothetical protein
LSAAFYGVFIFILCKVDVTGTRGIYYVANYVPRKGGQELYAFRDYKTDSSYQVLVLGSSHAYRGYDPRIFTSQGISLFNFGTSGQNSFISNHLLDHYITVNEGELFLLDVYAGMFEGAGTESYLRMIIHESSSAAALHLVQKSGDLRGLNTWCKRLAYLNEPLEYRAGGYQESGYTLIPDTLKSIKDIPGEYKPNPDFLKELEKLIKRIKKANANVVLVSHPMPPLPGYDKRHQGFLEDIESMISENSIMYLDHTFDIGYELWHFADENHLSQDGVNKFNPILIEELLKHDLLH